MPSHSYDIIHYLFSKTAAGYAVYAELQCEILVADTVDEIFQYLRVHLAADSGKKEVKRDEYNIAFGTCNYRYR